MKRLLRFSPIALALIPWPALAETTQEIICKGAQKAVNGTCATTTLLGSGGILTPIVNTLIYITGAISILMIVIGGMRFVLSGGSPSSVKGARETILYAVIGLIVSTLAYAIVTFVLTRVG